MNTPLPASRPQRGWKWSRLVTLLLLTSSLAPAVALAQAPVSTTGSHVVTGKVTAANGEGVPGVTVVLKGTTQGTSTDVNGSFTLTAPEGSILVFSSVGFTSRELAASASPLAVVLSENAQALDEVQVVGYGTQKKSQVTGAISTVTDEQLHDVPVANVGQALQGRAAGVTISSASSSPGQSPVIRIRGNRSISGSNDPLLVVDGVPYDGSLNDLNPDDISSLEVLKDASSTAIYGARGANGVILISTRRGKTGAARVTYSGYYGQKNAYGRFDLQNGQQYYDFRLQSFQAQNPAYNPTTTASFLTADERANYAAGKTTDYQDLIYQKGHIQNHSLGLSGGTEQTQYSASLGYYDETGIVPVQRIQRYSLRATLDQQIGKRIKVGINTLNTYTDEADPNVNIINYILTTSPLASPYGANGLPVLFPNTDTALPNPLTLYVPDAHKDSRRRLRTFNSLYGQVNILPGLNYRLNLGLDVRSENNGNFYASQTPQRIGGVNQASRSQNLSFNLLAENLLTYNKTFGKNELNFTGLYSAQQYSYDAFGAVAQNLPANYQLDNNLGAGTPTSTTSTANQWDIVSYMARLNYSFDTRYLATLTVRADGSSRLAPGNKYKAFPSAALAWNVVNEEFMKPATWVSNLKLRASLGRVGSTAVNPYQTLGLLQSSLGNGYYNYGSLGAVGVVPAAIPNPNLGWEYTTTANFGVDFGAFNNRITGSVEVYQQRTSDLLLPDALPGASGYTSFTRNKGQTQNRGLEISLTTVNVRTKSGFEWSTDWNFTVNRERILSLGLGTNSDGSGVSDIGNQRFIGQPLFVFYDYKQAGIWQANEAAQAAAYGSKVGQIKIEDVNGDGKIDANDRQIIGSRQPKFEAGMTQHFHYRGFDITAVGLTRVGATILDPLLTGGTYFTTFEGRRNQVNLDYWTPNNPTNAFPQPRQGNGDYPPYSNSLAYQSGTFIKVRSIDLGYTIPAAWAKAALMSSARIYIQVQNPYIWSPVKFFQDNKAIDPDALSYSNASLNYAGVNYPVTRSYIVGVNLGF